MRWSTGLVALLLLGTQAVQAATWNDLWWSRDQQGQRLLEERQPAKAAKVFEDGRHRGYAELAAGHYAEAAKLLGQYQDPDSLYNRGNALAYTGQLKDALQSYDAALAAAPGSADIVKNRDLVKKALDQQDRGSQSGHQNSSAEQGGQGADRTGGHAGAGSNSAGSNNRASQGGASQSTAGTEGNASSQGNARSQGNSVVARGNSASQDKAGAQSNATKPNGVSSSGSASRQNTNASQREWNNPAARPQNVPSNSGSQTGDKLGAGLIQHAATGNPNGAPARYPPTSAGPTANASGRGLDRDSIHQEMAATLQSSQTKGTNGSSKPPPPPSEQAIAMDQWLRTIPDDSGELLQRKFMIEHLMKQRGNEP